MLRDIFPAAKAILLDTNLFVVFVVGSTGLQIWGQSPVAEYEQSDFHLLSVTLSGFRRVITTPFVVAEVNSLLNTTYARETCRTELATIVPLLFEIYQESSRLGRNEGIARFGFTDMSILQAARETDALVISADGPLVHYLQGQRVPAIHYGDWKRIANG